MSDESRFKELMARLVAMSPEPPPYPEETPMTRNEKNAKPGPALVFLGAAAVVLALAIPLFLINRGDGPVAGDSTTTTSTPAAESTTEGPAPTTTTTTIETTTTMPTTTTEDTTGTTEVPIGVRSGELFLYQEPENSFSGNPALVPITVMVTGRFEPEVDLSSAWQKVIDDQIPLPGEMHTAIPAGVIVESQTVADGVIVADMSEPFLDGAGGLLAEMTMLNQLIYTLTYAEPDSEVLFTVNGQPVEAFGSEGLGLTDPLGRDEFLDHLNQIILTEPIVEVEHVYVVAGRANTFEASLTVQVVDGNGQVVHEEPLQATCGTGCWGEFGVGIASDVIVPGESSIRLLTYSAEDGSPSNVVTVPIPVAGVWDFTVGG